MASNSFAQRILCKNIGIEHVFLCIEVCQRQRDLVKTEGEAQGLQHFPRDLANTNAFFKKTRNCVYETLCPQLLACPPSCSPVNLFTILLKLTKSEATSFNSFRDIFIGCF